MHPTTKGTVFFANRCNLNCDHCYVSPVFKEKIERMSPSVFTQALKFMNAAQIPIVTISGGEPMLYWSDLKKGLANNPIRTITVCTNGFWGVDKTSRKSILMELPKYGISELEISTDVYHQVFVNLEDSIIPIIDEAQEIGLKVTVIVCMTHPVEVINTVNLLQKHLSVPSCLELRSISNFGSAANNLDIIPHTKGQVEQFICKQAGCPCITPTGDVYLCCGPPMVFKTRDYYLGNIISDDTNEVLSVLDNNVKAGKLRTQKISSLVPEFKSLLATCKVKSVCELCMLFMAK